MQGEKIDRTGRRRPVDEDEGLEAHERDPSSSGEDETHERLAAVLVVELVGENDVARGVLRQLCVHPGSHRAARLRGRCDGPSERSAIDMSSKVSTSSMRSFCLLTFTTIAALPALRRAKRNLRRLSLSDCGISTVRD
jgi:hypothetical protein